MESEDRSPYANDEHYSLKEYRAGLSMVPHISHNPTAIELIDRLGLRKPRAKRSRCPLCFRPRLREGDELCTSCSDFVHEALGSQGGFDGDHYSPPIVRAFVPMCYLCGDEPYLGADAYESSDGLMAAQVTTFDGYGASNGNV